MAEHIWMEHNVTHGRAMLPDLPYWRTIGWEPCDGPPPETDLTRDPAPITAEQSRKSKTGARPADLGS